MQKFCHVLELTRFVNTISIFIPHTHEHKLTQRREKCSRKTGGMGLVRNFHIHEREGTRHGFEPATLKIAVLLTNCAITTKYHRFSQSLLSYQKTWFRLRAFEITQKSKNKE